MPDLSSRAPSQEADAATTPLSPPSASAAKSPRSLTTFIGRNEQMAELHALLTRDGVRLLTLTGPGGVGKTRLAMRVAQSMEEFIDNVWFVPLASIQDASLVEPTIARALDIAEITGQDHPPGQTLAAALRQRRGLLILDNFEHLTEAVPLLARLVAACPALKILVTSRTVLRLSGEHVFEVPSLSLPPLDRAASIDDLCASDAVRLFVDRVEAVRPDFAPTASDISTIGAICRRLNGLPLAIELAAARITVLQPAGMLARLNQGMAILTGGPRDAPVRHRTMRDAIAWSYGLLQPHEQALLRRLAVFAGGFTLTAAEQIGDWMADGSVETEPGMSRAGSAQLTIDTLSSLVDQSLVQRVHPTIDSPEPRFELLGVIGEYAHEKLGESGEEAASRDAHAAIFQALAAEGETHLVREVDLAWLDRLEADHANLRNALAWSLIERQTPAAATRGVEIAGSLWLFWYYHSHLVEGRAWLERALAVPAPTPAPARAKAMVGLGTLLHYLGEHPGAMAVLADGVALLRELSDRSGTAYALTALGNVAEDDGRFDEATAYFTEANALFAEIGDQVNVAVTLYHLGVVAVGQDNLQLAMERLDEALALSRHMADPWSTAASLGYRGLVQAGLGEVRDAAAALGEALGLYVQLGTTERIAEILRRVAVLSSMRGKHAPALRLFAAADSLGQSIGVTQALPERTVYERAIAAARKGLPPSDQEAAWESGTARSMAEAISEAELMIQQCIESEEHQHTPQAAHQVNLTAREMDVLRLIVDGKTDSDVATALFISRRTATTHVGRIYAKLGVSSRSGAVAYALRHGLV